MSLSVSNLEGEPKGVVPNDVLSRGFLQTGFGISSRYARPDRLEGMHAVWGRRQGWCSSIQDRVCSLWSVWLAFSPSVICITATVLLFLESAPYFWVSFESQYLVASCHLLLVVGGNFWLASDDSTATRYTHMWMCLSRKDYWYLSRSPFSRGFLADYCPWCLVWA